MRRKAAAALVSLFVVVPWPALAQKDPAVELDAGIRQVEEGDLEAAVGTLDRVVQQLAGDKGRQKDLALAHLYLGMAHLGLDRTEKAKAEMREAWRNDKDLKLEAKKFPPRVRQLYDLVKSEAKEQAKAAEGAGKGAAVATPATPPESPAASAAAGASPPVPGLSLGARIRVSAPATSNKLVVGTVTTYDAASMTIRREGSGEMFRVPVSSASRFEISGGQPSKGRRTFFWGIGGAVALGGVGAAYGSGSKYSDCPDCDKRGVGKWAAIGAASGAVLGAIVGTVTTHETWRPAERPRVSLFVGGRSAWMAIRF